MVLRAKYHIALLIILILLLFLILILLEAHLIDITIPIPVVCRVYGVAADYLGQDMLFHMLRLLLLNHSLYVIVHLFGPRNLLFRDFVIIEVVF
jgi:hypothetical protein